MSYIGNQPYTAAFLVDTKSGDGTTTAFTLTIAPANTSSCIVAITGVLQDPSTYSVSGTTLTFSAAPPSGTNNISIRYLGIPASGVTTTAYRTVTEFTATSGQTSFSVPSYTVGYIDVYRNGVMLGTADFTATTGTTVVLASGATTGDLIRTESFYVSSVLNAIQQYNGSSTNQTLTTPTLTSPVITGSVPQVTVYTSGSGTYTTPTNARYIYVRLVGGGGGGGGSGNNSSATNGTGGGTTTFGSLSATGGAGGPNSFNGGFGGSGGGTGSGGDINVVGGSPSAVPGNTSPYAVYQNFGGAGGNSVLGGGGAPGSNGAGTTGNAGGSYGGGGSGAGTGSSASASLGGGGGGYTEKTITSLNATYSYSVGSGGAGGAAGGNGGTGGAGAAGVIIVTAYF